jgi:hypothetical protein
MTIRRCVAYRNEVKGQGPTKVITVRETPPCGHAPTYEISLTYLERQKSYGSDKLRWEAEAEEKIRLKQYGYNLETSYTSDDARQIWYKSDMVSEKIFKFQRKPQNILNTLA